MMNEEVRLAERIQKALQTRVRLSHRIRYMIYRLLERGLLVQMLILLLFAILLLLLTTFVNTLELSSSGGLFIERFRESVDLVFDISSHQMLNPIAHWLLLGGTLFGVSALAAVLGYSFQSHMQALENGYTRIIEKNHFLILGWSEQIFTIIDELAIACEDERNPCLVVLAEQSKQEMEEEIRLKVNRYGRLRIICRSGSPQDIDDLTMVSMERARAIIILAPEVEDPDSEVIRTALALTNHPSRLPRRMHIVAEIHNARNLEIAHVIGKEEIQWIEVGEFVSRLIARACSQSGLALTYTEMLDFEGDQVYFHKVRDLAGKTFGSVLNFYENCTVIGVDPVGTPPVINPPMDQVLNADDYLIYIAENEDAMNIPNGKPSMIDEKMIVKGEPQAIYPDHTLLLGWNWRGFGILLQLDHYVAPASDVLILADQRDLESQVQRAASHLRNLKLTVKRADITDRNTLNNLSLGRFDHIVLLGYSDILSRQKADARTLITLLHLRDILQQQGVEPPIVTEMLDIRNRDLAEITRPDDFIVSDKIVSMRLAQAAIDPYINDVFVDLFNPQGSEVYLKPVSDYTICGKPVNFYTIVEAARRREEVAIGYRLKCFAGDGERGYGVVINPEKSRTVVFSPGDRIIVLAVD